MDRESCSQMNKTKRITSKLSTNHGRWKKCSIFGEKVGLQINGY